MVAGLHPLHRGLQAPRERHGHDRDDPPRAAGALRHPAMDAVRHLARRVQRDPFDSRRDRDLRLHGARRAAQEPVMSWKPGDAREAAQSMIRVDQAGEYGATRIYAGQLAVMGDRTPAARTIAGMAAQEEGHRALFDAMGAGGGAAPP